MKTRISHILKAIAVIFFIGAIVALFMTKPMPSSSFEQRQLYESSTYQHLEKEGVATKGIVSAVSKEKESVIHLWVRFFTKEGTSSEACIKLIKKPYHEGDLVNIVYDPANVQSARIAPAEETTLNWPLFGWCMVMGVLLFWVGSVRYKVSGGLE